MIPTHFHIKTIILKDIIDACKTYHNDMDLGEVIRKIIKDYEKGSDVNIKKPNLDLDDNN